MNEDQVQKALVSHIRFRGVHGAVTQCVNNNPRSARDGARLVQMGLTKGYPDLIHCFDNKVVLHELKTKKGRLTPHQKKLHKKLAEAGMTVITSYGLDQAIEHCIEMGLIRG